MAKRPAFQFYPGDWLRDTALRSCSIGARGLWIDMLCLMHEGTPYGYLKVGGKVILPGNLARMVGAPVKQVENWLSELKNAEVFSISDENFCIFSRRMVRDEAIRLKRAEGGKLGGNPALTSSRGPTKVDTKVNLGANLGPTPSSSSSSSSAELLPLAIARTWWPSSETILDLQMVNDFEKPWIEQQVPSFVAYWLDRGEARPSWDAQFIDHCMARAKFQGVS